MKKKNPSTQKPRLLKPYCINIAPTYKSMISALADELIKYLENDSTPMPETNVNINSQEVSYTIMIPSTYLFMVGLFNSYHFLKIFGCLIIKNTHHLIKKETLTIALP